MSSKPDLPSDSATEAPLPTSTPDSSTKKNPAGSDDASRNNLPAKAPGDDGAAIDEKKRGLDRIASSVDNAQPLSSIKTTTYGVWTIQEPATSWSDAVPGLSIFGDLDGYRASLPYIRLLATDLWSLGPAACLVYLLAHIISSVVPTMRLARSSAFLTLVENASISKEIDRQALVMAITIQLVLCIVDWAVSQASAWSTPILQQRYKYHVNQRLMAIQLHLDLPTSENPDVKARLAAAGEVHGGMMGWGALSKLMTVGGLVIELISTSGFVLGTMVHQPGGRTLATLCLLGPIVNSLQARDVIKTFYATITNQPFLRMEALHKVAGDSGMKQELLSNTAGDYVLNEYGQARNEFGDTLDGHPMLRSLAPWSVSSLVQDLARDAALLILGFKMVLDPTAIPLTSVAMLQQTSMAITSTMGRLFQQGGFFLEALNKMKAFYEIGDIKNELKDGDAPYPAPGSQAKGMEIEFQNVFFKYPRTGLPVINGLSFKVAAGAICVIVGENGCGKSSTLKLLNRMYDVESGSILIDGKPIQDYKTEDLRLASALMHQEYQHFDLSLRENIGFGNVTRVNDMDAIKEAARLGGSNEFIEKLPESYDTTRNTGRRLTMKWGSIPQGSPLERLITSKKEPPKAFSGGETQRLALSRTFMRSTTLDVKLLAYDEPSAALDPKAEFALFERLRNLRDGRTMLFITHRFGHITKYADTIIYLENGRAVEQGSHDELLALGGKYAQLYDVQAQAFSQDK